MARRYLSAVAMTLLASDGFIAAKPLADLDPQWGDRRLQAADFLRLIWSDLSRK